MTIEEIMGYFNRAAERSEPNARDVGPPRDHPLALPLWEIAYQLAKLNQHNDGLDRAKPGKRDADGERGATLPLPDERARREWGERHGRETKPTEESLAEAIAEGRRAYRESIAVEGKRPCSVEGCPGLGQFRHCGIWICYQHTMDLSIYTKEKGADAEREQQLIKTLIQERDAAIADRDEANDCFSLAVRLKLKAQGELDAANQHLKILEDRERTSVVCVIRSCARTIMENRMEGPQAVAYLEGYAVTVETEWRRIREYPEPEVPRSDLAALPDLSTPQGQK